jgi:hypothetical protein
MKTPESEREDSMGIIDKLLMIWFFILLVLAGVVQRKGEN